MSDFLADDLQKFACKHKTRLDHLVKPMAFQLLDNFEEFKRRNRRNPHDLVQELKLKAGATSSTCKV